MPIIPGPSQVPEVDVRNTRRVQDVAADQSGAMLRAVGDAATELGARIADNHLKTQMAQADLDARMGLAEVERQFRDDPDWQSMEQRATAVARKLLEERGAVFRGRAADVWKQASASRVADFGLRMADQARRKGIDVTTADIVVLGDKAFKLETDPTSKPEDRAAARQTYMDRINGAAQSGLLDQARAASLRLEYEGKVRENLAGQSVEAFGVLIEDVGANLVNDASGWGKAIAGLTERIQSDPNLDARQKTKLLNAAQERLAVDAVGGLIERDPYAARKALTAKELTGPFADLNGSQLKAATNAAEARIKQVEAEQRTRVSDAVNTHVQMIRAGMPVDEPLPVGTVRRWLGNDKAAIYEAHVTVGAKAAGLQTKPTQDLLQMAYAPDNPGNTPQQAKVLQQNRAAAISVLQQRERDPAAYFMQRGLMADFGVAQSITQMAMGDPAAIDRFVTGVKQRSMAATAAASELGGMSPAVLTAQETQIIGNVMGQMNAGARADMLGKLSKTMPGDAYRALVQRLRPDSPVTVIAGARVGVERKVNGVPASEVARLMLEGEDLLNPPKDEKAQDGKSKVQMPPDGDLRTFWNRHTGAAFAGSPDTEDRSYQAYRAIYAAMASRKGELKADRVSPDIARQAAKLATGEIAEVGGRETVMPYGLSRDGFLSSLRRGWPALSAKHPSLAGTRPENLQFIPAGGGQYEIVGARAANGAPIRVIVSNDVERPVTPKPAPERRAAAPRPASPDE